MDGRAGSSVDCGRGARGARCATRDRRGGSRGRRVEGRGRVIVLKGERSERASDADALLHLRRRRRALRHRERSLGSLEVEDARLARLRVGRKASRWEGEARVDGDRRRRMDRGASANYLILARESDDDEPTNASRGTTRDAPR